MVCKVESPRKGAICFTGWSIEAQVSPRLRQDAGNVSLEVELDRVHRLVSFIMVGGSPLQDARQPSLGELFRLRRQAHDWRY